MQTIQAQVSKRLLAKSNRLFTGTLEGRIIEILQNARRAHATEVKITNREGLVIIEDNGCGIDDFQKLLDLGNSGWDEKLEAGEDPAGVGLFSLAPKKVIIISGDRKVVIDKDGWTGKPINVVGVNKRVTGTVVEFVDEKSWDFETVEKHAVFSGMTVIIDGKQCETAAFCSDSAVLYKKPGCRIEVLENISEHHSKWTDGWSGNRVLVNFHGQVVQLDWWPAERRRGLNILIDIVEKTEIRLMLPARTRLVENAALEKLKTAIELEYYKYYQRQDKHTLNYKEYLRARQLGIELSEAEPQFAPGLICDEYDMPVEVAMPEGFELKDCYLCFADELAETNAQLLSALGKFKDKPFVPVSISDDYMGYSWSKLAKVTKVEIETGKELLRHDIWCEELACFDNVSITAHTSDGKVFNSKVSMAISALPPKGKYTWHTNLVCVTEKVRCELTAENIWYHMGGFNDSGEGDTYDTQLFYFQKELDRFWNELIGPYETIRQQIVEKLYPLYGKWQKVTLTEDGTLEIAFRDGRIETVRNANRGISTPT